MIEPLIVERTAEASVGDIWVHNIDGRMQRGKPGTSEIWWPRANEFLVPLGSIGIKYANLVTHRQRPPYGERPDEEAATLLPYFARPHTVEGGNALNNMTELIAASRDASEPTYGDLLIAHILREWFAGRRARGEAGGLKNIFCFTDRKFRFCAEYVPPYDAFALVSLIHTRRQQRLQSGQPG